MEIHESTATFVACHRWQVLLTMATDEGDEAFDPSYMGTAEEVVNERVGDNDFVFIKGCTASKVRFQNFQWFFNVIVCRNAYLLDPFRAGFLLIWIILVMRIPMTFPTQTPAVSPCQACSILIRGANEFMLEEASRSVPRSTWYPKKNSCQTVKHVVNIMYLFYVVLVVSAWKNKIIKLIKQLLFHPRILHPLLSNSIWQVLKGAWCSMRCISNLGVQCSGSWGRCGRDCAQPALRGAFSCCQSHRADVLLGCFEAIFWGRVGFFEEVHRT